MKRQTPADDDKLRVATQQGLAHRTRMENAAGTIHHQDTGIEPVERLQCGRMLLGDRREALTEPKRALQVRQNQRGPPALLLGIGPGVTRTMDAEHADRAVRRGKHGPQHVVDIEVTQPLLIEAAVRLFVARHQILVGDDARHAVSDGALHPQVAAVPIVGPCLVPSGYHQVAGAFQQVHPSAVAVQFDHGAGRTEGLRDARRGSGPQRTIHRCIVEMRDEP